MQELKNNKSETSKESSNIINHKARKNNQFSEKVSEDIKNILKNF